MKVLAFKSFSGRVNGQSYHVAAGDVLEMPAGADWVRAGLVEEIEEGASPDPEPEIIEEIETATAAPEVELATVKHARGRSSNRSKGKAK